MKTKILVLSLALAFLVATARAADTIGAKGERFCHANRSASNCPSRWSVLTRRQRICKSSASSSTRHSGDTYQGAAKDTDAHLGGLLSALRNRGEFVGELGRNLSVHAAQRFHPGKAFHGDRAGRRKGFVPRFIASSRAHRRPRSRSTQG